MTAKSTIWRRKIKSGEIIPKRHVAWTMRDLHRLRLLYPVLNLDELPLAFWPHPIGSIHTTARARGLHRRGRRWVNIVKEHKPWFRFSDVVQEG